MQPALGATVGSSLVGCGVARAGAHRCDEGQPCGTAAYLYEERYLMHTFDHFCSVERRPLDRPTLRARRATSDPFLVFSHYRSNMMVRYERLLCRR
jgi:hypothetical protein